MTTDPQPYSPAWWLDRLERILDTRQPLIALYEDYYEGRHELTFASSKFREVFAQMLAAVADNWMPLVVRASVERLHVQGFRTGEAADTDDAAWTIWQRNGLDLDSQLLCTEAVKLGESALLVWPTSDGRAEITVEHPSQVVIAREAGNRRKVAAALKKWAVDESHWQATLYLPDAIYRFEKRERRSAGWTERQGVEHVSRHDLGRVPVIPVTNEPHMLPCRPPGSLLSAPHGVPDVAIGYGRSDLADVISTQDQLNKLLCDMLVASEVGAFRQRWATGLEVPLDEVTGKPIQPFKHAIDRLWVSEGAETKFGEFQATDLANFTRAIEQRIQSLAARTRTPPHYLLGQIVNASGDALKAAETGLTCKVRDKQRSFGEAIEEAIGLALRIEGGAETPSAEVDWRQIEARSESEWTDSLVKKMALGVPKEQLWADAGYSPQQIAEFKTTLADQALGLQGMFDLGAPRPEAIDAQDATGATANR